MKQRIFYIFAIILFAVLISACGPSQAELDVTAAQVADEESAAKTAAAPTVTPSLVPTNTAMPTNTATATISPTFTPEICSGDVYFYNPKVSTEDVGEIDGKEFSTNAEALEGASVDVTIDVIEAGRLYVEGGAVDGTLVLAVIEGDDGILYPATVFFPDKGFGINQFLHASIFEVSGVHLGLITPPENFFSSYADIGSEGYEGPFPTMIAVLAVGPC